jgi:predicted peroxiredoxin
MSESQKKLFVVITHGLDHELSSVGFTIANGGITQGLSVDVFLTSSGVDLVRKRAADATRIHPMEPLKDLIRDLMARGGRIYACTPCVKGRGYEQEDFIDGVVITGASVLHNAIKEGAATLSF